MDLELRLAALANLVAVNTDEVELRLLAELDRVESVLRNSVEYDELVGALKTLTVLAPRFHARVVPMLAEFVRTVSMRDLLQGGEPIPTAWRKYRSASHLIREAIEVPRSIRFVHISRLLDFLLELWRYDDDDVRGKAERALEALAEFDLNLFYGERGLGARPQAEIVNYFAALDDGPLVRHAEVILKMLSKVLSPSLEGHTWSYDSVTISRGEITAGLGVREMRASAVALLKRMYPLDEAFQYRKHVLNVIGTAMRRERPGINADTSAMFDRDAVEVLNFFRDLVNTEELQLIQMIEHSAYWAYYHAGSLRVSEAALKVRDAIGGCPEYKIYKQLIGFEGIHGVWESLKSSEEAWDYSDTKRMEAAARYVSEIDNDTYAVWRDRILRFSKTRSDDLAAFPVYYEFLKSVGQDRPELALELIRDHMDVMEPFLIALLLGLWSSERSTDAEAIARQWIAEHSNLTILAKSLNVEERPRLDLLSEVISKADSAENTNAIVEAMGVAARQYGRGLLEAKSVFMQGMRAVARRGDARWANVVWYSRDFRKLVTEMDHTERAEVLASMAPLQELRYQAEEVLYAIGEHDSEALLSYLMERVRSENAKRLDARTDEASQDDRFEAIPYSLQRLNKLLVTMPKEVLSAVRKEYSARTAGMFQYSGGARLVKAAFPELEQSLQNELLSYIRSGNPEDIDFVIAIVRSYGGEAPILPLCKEIVRAVPERSGAWTEMAAALESTGVVSGEYGTVHAYEALRSGIVPLLSDDDPKVRAFAAWLIEDLDQFIVRERRRADEGLALRKYKYGIGKNEA
ncbi:hypothetical protein [Cupriavidus pauculus]|uniref:hypothetical protein n=1 Tax=Cupriavidus pauculus TaxID=82633 RepID=UPI001EE1F9CA|nr:hypothetical protein [Cupriavidus pauculus]GJG96825.1 hypothetical protein CBA19C6_20070 [Cupriavidus pauculus]